MNRKFRRLQRCLVGACLSASLLAGAGLAGVARAADAGGPIATRDFVAVRSGETVTVDVTSNDAHQETASADLVVTAVGGADAGTASLVSGEVRYAAPAGYYGSDSFGYIVRDGDGTTATGTVDVFVYPDDAGVNDPGFARDDVAAVEKNGSVEIQVLLNDVDPEGDANSISPIENVSDPAHGSVTDDGNTVTYSPDTDYVGTDTFTYDLPGGGATATVTVTVIGDADGGPVPGADQIHAFDGESILIPVLANDADPDGDTLTLISAGVLGLEGDPDAALPARGTVSVDGDNVQFDAGPYTGSVFVEYIVEDADGNQATGFVEVLVTPYNTPASDDPPIANPDLAVVYAGQEVSIPFLQNDVDAEAATIQLKSAASLGAGFALADDGSGLFQAHSPSSDVVVELTYRIRTAGGGEADGSAFVLVLGNGGGGGGGGGGAGGGGGGPLQPFVRSGYRLVASDGGVFNYGGATFHGSTGALALNRPIVGLAGTKSDKGYWLVASDGGIFAFGDARFFGSTGGMKLNQPIVGMAASPTGLGYWLVASDGGIFAFGDARFFGSAGAMKLNQPIVGMTAAPTWSGYQLVARDGGVFSFGAVTFLGSLPGQGVVAVVAALSPTPTGLGYYVATAGGQIYGFGDAKLAGAPLNLNKPIVGIY